MMNKMVRGTLFWSLVVMMLFIVACSNGNEQGSETKPEGPDSTETEVEKTPEPEKPVPLEPITLSFYTAQNSSYANEDNFMREIGNVVMAKYPHITIKHTHRTTGKDYKDLITVGEIPDIILESRNNVELRIVGNGLQYDLSDMIKKHNFDLSRIQDSVLQQMINSNQSGDIYGLPFSVNAFIMFYNKDIFDKFGADYPTDGMTWDETYELARSLSRIDGDTNYHGFQAFEPLFLSYNQLSLSPLDLKEDKSAVNTEPWARLLNDRKRFYEIPNNSYIHVDEFPNGYMAMGAHVSEMLINWPQKNPELNWDVVALPTYKESPRIGLQANAYFLFVAQTSKYKDEAFQVIAHLLSEEGQMELSKSGALTPLVSQSVQQSLGASIEHLQGKNLQAAFYNDYALPAPARADGLTYYNPNSVMSRAFTNDIIENKKDVNTVLRELEDVINKAIQAEKSKN